MVGLFSGAFRHFPFVTIIIPMAVRPRLIDALAGFAATLAMGAWLFGSPAHPIVGRSTAPKSSVSAAAAQIDAAIESHWKPDIQPSPVADDLQIARRMALALRGSIPALTEIRWLESRPQVTRLDEWTERLLGEQCFADYFAERFARALVHSKGSDFPMPFRRDCFLTWLTEQIAENRPYDQIVHDIMTAKGVWTNDPAANFFTAHEADPIRLTTRTARTFLGLRLDCAQCHDHPFADWKQRDFHGLAAFYGATKLARFSTGIHDVEREYSFLPVGQESRETIAPQVPFSPNLLSRDGHPRERLANWVTHPENPYFAKALVNRVWALLFGVGLIEPIDDLNAKSELAGALDVAAAEFKRSGYDLKHIIRVIAGTDAFRRQSAFHANYAEESEAVLAAFPSTRLRPEQLARAMLQTLALQKNDYAESWYFRLAEWGLVDELGDKYEEEMEPREGNLAQRLVMMNTRSLNLPLNNLWGGTAAELNLLSKSPQQCVESAFLICLTRRPNGQELRICTDHLKNASLPQRAVRLQDLFWVLNNGSEFCWQH